MRRSRLLAALLFGAGLLWPGGGVARTALSFPYPLPVVYNTALRFLRIDRGCQITERDPEAAYLLFECREGGGKPRRGALELYAMDRGVKGHLNLLDEPRYMELRLLELLGQKLREERGDPPQPPAPPAPVHPPARPTDGGT